MSSVGNINPATNRFYGPDYAYDDNGNLTKMPGAVVSRYMSYDPWNRLEEVNDYGAVESYGYSPDGQRVYKSSPGEDPVFYFRGAGGEMMAEYGLETWTDTGFTGDAAVRYRSFGGKLLGMETGYNTYKVLQMDRAGSVVGDGEYVRYLRPYGEAHWAPEVNQPRFATYYRDEQTGFDYAQQRYYSSQIGRFLTADPSGLNWNLADPASWNNYSYVQGDPVNFNDPSGLRVAIDDPFDQGGGWWSGIFSVPVWGPEGYVGSLMAFPSGNPPVPALSSDKQKVDPRREAKFRRDMNAAKKNWSKMSRSIREAVPSDGLFTPQMIDCMAGLESAWDPKSDGPGVRTGLFQYDQAGWEGDTSTPYSIENVQDVGLSVAAALNGLGWRHTASENRQPDRTARQHLARAFSLFNGQEAKFGEYGYGGAILDCAALIDTDFSEAFRSIWELLNP